MKLPSDRHADMKIAADLYNEGRKLDEKQKALMALLFEIGQPGEARLDLVFQSAMFVGATAAIKSAEFIAPSSMRYPLLCRFDAGAGLYQSVSDVCDKCGVRGNGYGERIKALVWHAADLKRAATFVVDHCGNMHPDRWAQLFRCADYAASRSGVAVRVVIIQTMIHRWDSKKGEPVIRPPFRNHTLYPRHRTYELGTNGFTFVKAAKVFEHEAAPVEQRDIRIA